MAQEKNNNKKDVLFLEGFFFLLKEAFKKDDKLVKETLSTIYKNISNN